MDARMLLTKFSKQRVCGKYIKILKEYLYQQPKLEELAYSGSHVLPGKQLQRPPSSIVRISNLALTWLVRLASRRRPFIKLTRSGFADYCKSSREFFFFLLVLLDDWQQQPIVRHQLDPTGWQGVGETNKQKKKKRIIETILEAWGYKLQPTHSQPCVNSTRAWLVQIFQGAVVLPWIDRETNARANREVWTCRHRCGWLFILPFWSRYTYIPCGWHERFVDGRYEPECGNE